MTAEAADDGRRLVETRPTYQEAVDARQLHAGLLRSLGHGSDHGVSIDVLHYNGRTGKPDSFGIFVRAYSEEDEAPE